MKRKMENIIFCSKNKIKIKMFKLPQKKLKYFYPSFYFLTHFPFEYISNKLKIKNEEILFYLRFFHIVHVNVNLFYICNYFAIQ